MLEEDQDEIGIALEGTKQLHHLVRRVHQVGQRGWRETYREAEHGPVEPPIVEGSLGAVEQVSVWMKLVGEATNLYRLLRQIPRVARRRGAVNFEVFLVRVYDEQSVATQYARQICANKQW